MRNGSQFDDVRQLAEDIWNAFYSMAKTGKQNEHEPIANKAHMDDLHDMLLNRK